MIRSAFRSASVLCTLAIGLGGTAGCGAGMAEGGSEAGLAEVQGGLEMGLQRGSGWSTFKIKPPYIVGPNGNLRLRQGKLSGVLSTGGGGTGRGMNVTISPETISGMGPYGPIEVAIKDGPEMLEADGLWNGSRVRLTITPESLRGTIAVAQGGQVGNTLSCQYVLDRVENNGTRAGSSTCLGLPQATRLDVPREIQAWLTRPEMLAVVLALMSVPPSIGDGITTY